jgi:hypothetical protein
VITVAPDPNTCLHQYHVGASNLGSDIAARLKPSMLPCWKIERHVAGPNAHRDREDFSGVQNRSIRDWDARPSLSFRR